MAASRHKTAFFVLWLPFYPPASRYHPPCILETYHNRILRLQPITARRGYDRFADTIPAIEHSSIMLSVWWDKYLTTLMMTVSLARPPQPQNERITITPRRRTPWSAPPMITELAIFTAIAGNPQDTSPA